MLFRLTPLFLFAVLALASCDPAVGVVIANKTNADRKIKVFYTDEMPSPHEQIVGYDSIWTYPNGKLYGGSSSKIPVMLNDTSARFFCFVLRPGYTAFIENIHLGTRPRYGKVIIIDDADTIRLIRHGKDFNKGFAVMGGIWTHSIRDK